MNRTDRSQDIDATGGLVQIRILQDSKV